MILSKDEYMIKGDSIIIPKKVLERLKQQYHGIADAKRDRDNSLETFYFAYYSGKASVLTDLLKLFEPLEG